MSAVTFDPARGPSGGGGLLLFALDPRIEHRARFETRDERIARRIAVVNDDVPETLGVDHEPGTAVQRLSLIHI